MPSSVACPVCGADGTAASNQIIAQTSGAPAPVPVAASTPVKLAMPVASVAPATTSSPGPRAVRPAGGDEGESEGEKWKWWYFVLAGVCIAGYSIWQAYNQHRIKPLGELFFAVFCIAIGIWDFQHKRKKKRAQG
jgi:hypothetical protein